MSKKLSGQYTIQENNTAEHVAGIDDINAPSVTVHAPSGNGSAVYIGNDGDDSVDNSTGVRIPSGGNRGIAMGKVVDGSSAAKVYVYGSAGDTIRFVAST